MDCVECNGPTRVYDCRERPNHVRLRRRQCIKCGHRFKTFESPGKAMTDYRSGWADCLEEINNVVVQAMADKERMT